MNPHGDEAATLVVLRLFEFIFRQLIIVTITPLYVHPTSPLLRTDQPHLLLYPFRAIAFFAASTICFVDIP